MLTAASAARTRDDSVFPQLDQWLRRSVVAGLALVMIFPLARGQIPWLGLGPLWLVGMPLAAWWALHRFRLPWPRPSARPARHRRRLRAQARRRTLPASAGWSRAA